MVIHEKRILAARLKSFVLIFCFSVMLLLYIVIVIEQEGEIYRSPNRSPNISFEHSSLDNEVINKDLTSMKSSVSIYQRKNATVKRNNLQNHSKTKLPIQYNFLLPEHPRMSKMLRNFPWEQLKQGAKNDTLLYTKYRQHLIDELEFYAYLEPAAKINSSCTRPPVLVNASISCSEYSSAFLPQKHKSPVRVGHAIQLGFDVDTLEIHLNEIYDVIDFFFILESTRTNCESFRKKLTWDEVSTQQRFSKFREKGL